MSWNGQQFPDQIPDNVACEVFSEIFRVSFTEELLMADRYLYELREDDREDGELGSDLDASSREERNLKVMSAIPGMLDGGDLGFGSADLALRQRSLYGLYRVMSGWTRVAAMAFSSIRVAERLGGPATLSLGKIEDAELHVAYHYIISFAGFFKRAPVLPHL